MLAKAGSALFGLIPGGARICQNTKPPSTRFLTSNSWRARAVFVLRDGVSAAWIYERHHENSNVGNRGFGAFPVGGFLDCRAGGGGVGTASGRRRDLGGFPESMEADREQSIFTNPFFTCGVNGLP